MVLSQSNLDSAIVESLKKRCNTVLETPLVKAAVEEKAGGVATLITHYNTHHNANIVFGQEHVDAMADAIAKAFAPLAVEEKKLESEIGANDQAAIKKLRDAFDEKIFAAYRDTDKTVSKTFARHFELPETLRKSLAQAHGVDAKEFERPNALTRFFRDGEKMRWGRVTGVGLGVAAAGAGLAYLLSGDKKDEQPKTWASRVESTPGNSPQHGV